MILLFLCPTARKTGCSASSFSLRQLLQRATSYEQWPESSTFRLSTENFSAPFSFSHRRIHHRRKVQQPVKQSLRILTRYNHFKIYKLPCTTRAFPSSASTSKHRVCCLTCSESWPALRQKLPMSCQESPTLEQTCSHTAQLMAQWTKRVSR